jgi:hypothetical protein
MGSGTGWFPVALLLLAASILSPRVVAAAAAGGEAEHAVQQHSERISGAPNFSPFFISKLCLSKVDSCYDLGT